MKEASMAFFAKKAIPRYVNADMAAIFNFNPISNGTKILINFFPLPRAAN